MIKWLKWTLAIMLVFSPILGLGQSSFYTDRAVGTFPGFNHVTNLVPIQYGQVRVCTSADIGTSVSPCPNVASITDTNGNPLAISGGNFGQLTTDITGRFSFGCAAGNFLIQVASSGSNTPQLSYPISCPVLSGPFGATSFIGDVTMTSAGCYKWGSVGLTVPDTFLCRGGLGLVKLGTTVGAVNGTLDLGIVAVRQNLQTVAGSAGAPPLNFGLGSGLTSGLYFVLNGGVNDQVGISADTLPSLVVKSGRTDIFGSVSSSTTPGLAFGNDGVLDSAIWRTGGKTFSIGSSTIGDASGTIVANTHTSNGAGNGVFIGSHVTPGILQFTDLVSGSTVLSGVGNTLFVGNALNDTSGTVLANQFVGGSGGSTSQSAFLAQNAGTVAGYAWNATANAVDNRFWDFIVNGTHLQGRLVNDAHSAAGVWVDVGRSGVNPTLIDFSLSGALVKGVQFQATSTLIAGTTPVGGMSTGDVAASRSATSGYVFLGSDGTKAIGRSSGANLDLFSFTNLTLYGATSGTANIGASGTGGGVNFTNNAGNTAFYSASGDLGNAKAGGALILSGSTGQVSIFAPTTASGNIFFPATGGGTITLSCNTCSQTLSATTLSSPAISNPTTTGTDSGTKRELNTRIDPRFLLTTSASAAPQTLTADSDGLDVNAWNMTGTAGTLTIAAPTGTPVEGQKLILRIKTTNSWTYSFNATFRFSTTVTAPTTTTAGKTDYIGCMWNGADSKWDVVAVDQGH